MSIWRKFYANLMSILCQNAITKSSSNWTKETIMGSHWELLSCCQDDVRCFQMFYACFQMLSGCSQSEWPTIAQNLRSVCFQAFLGAFLPHVQGVPMNPHVQKQKVPNIYCKGVGSQNAWLWAALDQSLSYSGGLIESCPYPGIFDSLPPEYIWQRG